jgi:hypothetical protein
MKDKMLFDYIFSGQILEFEIHAFMNNKGFWDNSCHYCGKHLHLLFSACLMIRMRKSFAVFT